MTEQPSHSTPSSQTTPERPWLGLAHFTAADRDYFYGRDVEIAELTERVRRAPLTVLYGVSGYGKSSIFGAGLIPALESDGHRVTLLRRCYDDLAEMSLVADVVDAVLADWGEAGAMADDAPVPTLWEFFHERQRPWLREREPEGADADPGTGAPDLPVLLLDQFEEIFIKGEDRATGDPDADARAGANARDFLTQLADLVENRPPAALRRQLDGGTSEEKRALLRRYDFQARPVRVAIALREDFLARLERWRRAMPSLMEHRIELRLLSGPQAYRAVHEPGTKRPGRPPIIPPPVAEAIVRAAAGAGPDTPLEEIDAVPPILSLLCERLNDRRLAAAVPAESIGETDFSPGEASRILGAFYEDKLRPHPRAVREYLEDKLVSDSGFRENVTLDSALAALRDRGGVADAAARLRQLVDDRILAIEDRGGKPRVEFTHDTLARLALDQRIERQGWKRRLRTFGWAAAAFFLGTSLLLSGWALKERQMALSGKKDAEAIRRVAEYQRQIAEVQLERAGLEEGRAWLERARLAWEGKKEPLAALMLAGRALGFHGFGRQAEEIGEFAERYPSLLGAPMREPANEAARVEEGKAVRAYADTIRPTGLPIWSSPVRAHHRGPVSSVAFSPDGTRLASGSSDKTVKLWDVATGKEIATLSGHENLVSSVAFSPDGKRLASGSSDKTVKLWDAATGKEIATLPGHKDEVSSVAFSPDGTRLASGSFDNTVKLWDAATGKEIARLAGHEGSVKSVAFSPDGTRLASGAEDKTVKLWDVATGKEIVTLPEHSFWVSSVAFSPDGTRLASGSYDKTVKIWDAATGKEIVTLPGHEELVMSVAFSPDGTRLASGSFDNIVKLWDVATGKEIAMLAGHEGSGSSVAFSPDGTRLASGSWDGTVKLSDAATGKEIATLFGHSEAVISVAFSPDGARLASGSWDKTVKLWDVATGKEIATLPGHSEAVISLAFSPDGTRLASGSFDNTVKLWDVATGKEIAMLAGHEGSVFSVAFSPDGTRLASGSGDETVKLWDAATGKEIATLLGHSEAVISVAFSPDGARLALGAWDKTVKLWDAATGKEIAMLPGHEKAVISVAFSPDGTRLASGSEDQTVKLWDAATGKEIATLLGHSEGVNSVAFSPDGTRLASGAGDKTVKIWDVATGKEIATLLGHSETVMSVAFSPDGARLASGSGDTTVKLWDAATGKEIATLPGHEKAVTSVAFSPDGTRLASGAWDKTVKLWDAATGKEVATLPGHEEAVMSVAFSPDGTRLASGSGDETVKIWDAATGKEIATLLGHSEAVISVAFSPDGTRLASGSSDKTVKIWDAATGKEITTLPGHSEAVIIVAFSPDGTRLASGSFDNTVKLWDAATGKEIATLLGHEEWVMSVAFSPDGTRLASGSWDKAVKLWDAATGNEIATLPGHEEPVSSVAFSPDGTRLSSGAEDQTVKLWDAATGKEIATLRGHSEGVSSVAFSPDGTRLASGSGDNTVKLWDATTGGELPAPPDFPAAPDGRATAPDCGTPADAHGSRVVIDPSTGSPDLLAYERAHFFTLQDREVVWQINDSLLSARSFPVLHPRHDLLAQLANPDLTPATRLSLRVEICGQGGAWRMLPPLWAEARAAGLEGDPALRRLAARHLAIAARTLAVQEVPAFPPELWGLLTTLTDAASFADPGYSVALAQAFPPLIQAGDDLAADPGLIDGLSRAVLAAAPRSWIEAVAAHLTEKAEGETAAGTARRQQILNDALERYPESAGLLRASLGAYTYNQPERIPLEDRLLALPEAEAKDFTNAAHGAAQRNEADRAKALLARADARFPGDESVNLVAGWSHLKLNDSAAALGAFGKARALLKADEKPSADMLTGLAFAQWLSERPEEAIATYKQLIETGRAQEPPEDWADPKTIAVLDWPEAERKPLEALRAATLAKHPALAPQAQPEPNSGN